VVGTFKLQQQRIRISSEIKLPGIVAYDPNSVNIAAGLVAESKNMNYIPESRGQRLFDLYRIIDRTAKFYLFS
jgi:Cu(I)/Ag(I) efflux system membrane fusion protein